MIPPFCKAIGLVFGHLNLAFLEVSIMPLVFGQLCILLGFSTWSLSHLSLFAVASRVFGGVSLESLDLLHVCRGVLLLDANRAPRHEALAFGYLTLGMLRWRAV